MKKHYNITIIILCKGPEINVFLFYSSQLLAYTVIIRNTLNQFVIITMTLQSNLKNIINKWPCNFEEIKHDVIGLKVDTVLRTLIKRIQIYKEKKTAIFSIQTP